MIFIIFKEFFSLHYNKIYKLSVFSIGGIFNLGLKLALVYFFGFFLPAYINYFITHLIIIVSSFLFHSKITFRQTISIQKFIKCVIILKIVDYGFFLAFVYIGAVSNMVSVIISTGISYILRFIIMDNFIFNGETKNEKYSGFWCNINRK